jgi:AraC-like DNA-binding protein
MPAVSEPAKGLRRAPPLDIPADPSAGCQYLLAALRAGGTAMRSGQRVQNPRFGPHSGPIWIEGRLERLPEGASGPLVFGADWLLEMLRSDSCRSTMGFYWAPFSIIRNFPDLSGMADGRFVGYSAPGRPPHRWLTESMVFDLGDVPLVHAPEALAALFAEPLPFVSTEGNAPVASLSRRAKTLIASSYRGPVSIAAIARQVRVSHAHLTRQFKRDYGLTPIDYCHRLRVSDAMGRLSLGGSILDVGYDVGFNDVTRFYEDFRKVTGTSPGKCRSPLRR